MWKVTKKTIPKYKDLVIFLSNNAEVKNVNLIRFFQLVNGPLLSVYFPRCGVRCANAALYYAAYEKCSLWSFLNKNTNYQIISCFELYVIQVAPKKVNEFIYSMIFHRIKKHKSWDCSSEGLDYRMEEKNKVIKQALQSENPTMEDWCRAASNVENMETILQNSRNDYSYMTENSEPYAPKYQEKIDYCRSKIRESEFLDYDEKRPLTNLDEAALHKDYLFFEQKAIEMKKEYLENIISSQSFVNAAIPTHNFQMFTNVNE